MIIFVTIFIYLTLVFLLLLFNYKFHVYIDEKEQACKRRSFNVKKRGDG